MNPGDYLVRCIAPYATQPKDPPPLPTVHPLYWDAMAGKGYMTTREIADETQRSFAGVRKQITILKEKGPAGRNQASADESTSPVQVEDGPVRQTRVVLFTAWLLAMLEALRCKRPFSSIERKRSVHDT
jgi:hypothetical protein